MYLPFQSNPEDFNHAIDNSFEQFQDSLAIFKDQDISTHQKDIPTIPNRKQHHKSPNRKIIREVRSDHSSILAELDYNIAQKGHEKKFIFTQLKQKSQLPYEEIDNLRQRINEIHEAKSRLTEIQSEIKNLEESKNLILNSLRNLDSIAAAFCKKSQKKHLNNNQKTNRKRK